MGMPLYQAMTPGEMQSCPVEKSAYLACHFSAQEAGLTDLPGGDSRCAMVTVNDRLLPCCADAAVIRMQLLKLYEQQQFERLLLDFQRPRDSGLAAVAAQLRTSFPCPVGVTPPYAKDSPGPVFLPPVPLLTSLEAHLLPWKAQEIWLDVSLPRQTLCITAAGASFLPESASADTPLRAQPELQCHYQMVQASDRVLFHLCRTREDLQRLLTKAQALGVRAAAGLYQELAEK